MLIIQIMKIIMATNLVGFYYADDEDDDGEFDATKRGQVWKEGGCKYGRILPLWALQPFCAIMVLPLVMITILIDGGGVFQGPKKGKNGPK